MAERVAERSECWRKIEPTHVTFHRPTSYAHCLPCVVTGQSELLRQIEPMHVTFHRPTGYLHCLPCVVTGRGELLRQIEPITFHRPYGA